MSRWKPELGLKQILPTFSTQNKTIKLGIVGIVGLPLFACCVGLICLSALSPARQPAAPPASITVAPTLANRSGVVLEVTEEERATPTVEPATATDEPPTATQEPTEAPPTDTPRPTQPPATATEAPTLAPTATLAPPTLTPAPIVPTDTPLPVLPTDTVAAPAAPPPAGGYVCPNNTPCIKGNISSSSGDKIYHYPGCTNYDDTVINESAGERWFVTGAEAEAAGWRRAKNCP